MRWYLSNMKVIQIIYQLLLQDRKFCLQRKLTNGALVSPTPGGNDETHPAIAIVIHMQLDDHEIITTETIAIYKIKSPKYDRRLDNTLWNVNKLRPKQNGRHFADDIFKCIFLNENVSIPIKISLQFVPKGPINNFAAFVEIMAWCRPGDKPLSEPMIVSLPTHICVTRPQWVKTHEIFYNRILGLMT